jgi:hypothetical protein
MLDLLRAGLDLDGSGTSLQAFLTGHEVSQQAQP